MKLSLPKIINKYSGAQYSRLGHNRERTVTWIQGGEFSLSGTKVCWSVDVATGEIICVSIDIERAWKAVGEIFE
jgi:hypothetical protein